MHSRKGDPRNRARSSMRRFAGPRSVRRGLSYGAVLLAGVSLAAMLLPERDASAQNLPADARSGRADPGSAPLVQLAQDITLPTFNDPQIAQAAGNALDSVNRCDPVQSGRRIGGLKGIRDGIKLAEAGGIATPQAKADREKLDKLIDELEKKRAATCGTNVLTDAPRDASYGFFIKGDLDFAQARYNAALAAAQKCDNAAFDKAVGELKRIAEIGRRRAQQEKAKGTPEGEAAAAQYEADAKSFDRLAADLTAAKAALFAHCQKKPGDTAGDPPKPPAPGTTPPAPPPPKSGDQASAPPQPSDEEIPYQVFMGEALDSYTDDIEDAIKSCDRRRFAAIAEDLEQEFARRVRILTQRGRLTVENAAAIGRGLGAFLQRWSQRLEAQCGGTTDAPPPRVETPPPPEKKDDQARAPRGDETYQQWHERVIGPIPRLDPELARAYIEANVGVGGAYKTLWVPQVAAGSSAGQPIAWSNENITGGGFNIQINVPIAPGVIVVPQFNFDSASNSTEGQSAGDARHHYIMPNPASGETGVDHPFRGIANVQSRGEVGSFIIDAFVILAGGAIDSAGTRPGSQRSELASTDRWAQLPATSVPPGWRWGLMAGAGLQYTWYRSEHEIFQQIPAVPAVQMSTTFRARSHFIAPRFSLGAILANGPWRFSATAHVAPGVTFASGEATQTSVCPVCAATEANVSLSVKDSITRFGVSTGVSLGAGYEVMPGFALFLNGGYSHLSAAAVWRNPVTAADGSARLVSGSVGRAWVGGGVRVRLGAL